LGKSSKQASNVYSAEINKWIKAALRPGARTGQVLSLSFTCHSTQNMSFWRRSSQPISWLTILESKGKNHVKLK